MKTVRSRTGGVTGLLAVAALLAAPALQAQTTTMPSTLRYGSGLMDIPVASVLPHLAITGTFSGFFVETDGTLIVDGTGNAIGVATPGTDQFFADASVAVGLFDRLEVGGTLQSLNDAGAGGEVWGLFGRLALLKPEGQGLGLAVGSRYVIAPDYGDGIDRQPNRLGFADARFRESFSAKEDPNTELTFYGVATAHVRGFEQEFLPEHDLTFNLGYGSGLFKDGGDLPWYAFTDSDGWFFGSALHVGLGDNAVLALMGEYNGFDVNVGAQLDVNGIRVGAHLLGANYSEDLTEYRSSKFGVLGSVAVCPEATNFLCKPHLIERPAPDTVRLPAPPPDTVRITREVAPPLPSGSPARICLATGQNVQVMVTAAGDTLVGPGRVSIDDLRPGVVFAGSYADGAAWFVDDEAVTFERRSYSKSGGEVRMDCGNIMRVGEHTGVPLFAQRNAERPFQTIYVPVRAGVWQAYQSGLQRTRGW